MKRFVIVAALAALVSACGDDDNGPTGPSNTGPIVFTSQLSAANEVSPSVTNAESSCRGTATITFNVPRDSNGAPTGGGTANFAAQISECPAGTVVRAAHIHTGAAGTPGGVLVDTGQTPANAVTLANGSGTLSYTDRTITQEQATNIANNPGGFYFNVHSNTNPSGFVRGQLVRQN